MRIPTMLSLSIETVQALKAAAAAAGVPHSRLAEQFLVAGLALPVTPAEAPRVQVLTRTQSDVLAALTAEWIRVDDLEKKTGHMAFRVWHALNALRAQGLVECQVDQPKHRLGVSCWKVTSPSV